MHLRACCAHTCPDPVVTHPAARGLLLRPLFGAAHSRAALHVLQAGHISNAAAAAAPDAAAPAKAPNAAAAAAAAAAEPSWRAQPGTCPSCGGTGRIACKECEGRGFLARGGYNKKNPVTLSRIVGSKWTAMATTLGWRHFRVVQLRKLDRQHSFLLLQASCDSSAQLWVNAQALRNRSCWAAGWLQMSEITATHGSAAKCQACSGLGFKPCQTCQGEGKAQLVLL